MKSAQLLPHELYQIAEKEHPKTKGRAAQHKIRDSPTCYEPPKSRSSLKSQTGQIVQEIASRKSENQEEVNAINQAADE